MVRKKQNIERKILEKIKSGEIQMEPKWKFVVKIWEKRALWISLIFAVGLSISGIAFFAQRYNPKDLFEYGSVGWQVFYEDFPYYWLFGAFVFWISGIKIWQEFDNNYQVTSEKVFLISGMILVTIIGLILFLN
jgi:hypothetical protein